MDATIRSAKPLPCNAPPSHFSASIILHQYSAGCFLRQDNSALFCTTIRARSGGRAIGISDARLDRVALKEWARPHVGDVPPGYSAGGRTRARPWRTRAYAHKSVVGVGRA